MLKSAIFALIAVTMLVGVAGAAIVTVNPTSSLKYNPVTITASAVDQPLTLDYAGSGATSCASNTPVSTPCGSASLDGDPSQCAVYVGSSTSITGCIGGGASYTFCVFNKYGQAEGTAKVTTTSQSGTCFGGWGYSGPVISALCSAYDSLEDVILVLGVFLLILGGTLYGGSHLMPGQSKGTLQAYAMGILLGGIVCLIFAVLAPYIFTLIVGTSFSSC